MRKTRRLARAGKYVLTDYCVSRMVQRDVMPEDIQSALCRASQALLQANGRWRVVGPNVDAEQLPLVVEVRPSLIVVTVYRGEDDGDEDR